MSIPPRTDPEQYYCSPIPLLQTGIGFVGLRWGRKYALGLAVEMREIWEISVEIPYIIIAKMGGFIMLRMRINLENCACAEF